MYIRILGAILIAASCGGFGLTMAANHKNEVKTLRCFIESLEYMESELQYRLTPLPDLFRTTANMTSDTLSRIYIDLSNELECQISPDAEQCMNVVIQHHEDIPKLTREALSLLGNTLGHFDLDGQVRCLDRIKEDCLQKLSKYTENQETRLRSYKTLGLCAGAAIAILLF